MWTENFQMFRLDLEKAEEPGQISNIRWMIEKARDFQKNICFIDNAKAFDCVDHHKVWKILEEISSFLILLFSSISLHWSLRKAFLSLLAILWNSALK